MKQQLKETSISKDSLERTGGEWYIDDHSQEYMVSIHSHWSDKNPVATSATFGDYRGSVICEMQYNSGAPTKEQAIANAKAICEAVNNYNALKSVNKELIEALEKSQWVLSELQKQKQFEKTNEVVRAINKNKSALQKAKQL